jgi:hypothetical protein
MKKARITFNDVEKIVEITDDFYTDYRVSEKYCKKIISLIEEKFSVKVKEDAFYHEFEVSEDDFKNDIVIDIEAYDGNFVAFNPKK